MHPGHPAAIIVLCCAALLFCDYLLADSNRTDSLDADKLIQLASRYEERGLRHQTAALLQEVSQMTTNVL
jgi:hypothetical protein